ncbi:MAG TPA: heavy metal translocating P-type ATPase metal-binding domain-containing protein, partial [Saprospiraceae bacterium]|nr:heavy metal translocating P-type ATPase metal-binding domain-containing protein [Saprospiraceae bacterium]
MSSNPITTRLRCDHCGDICPDGDIYLGDKRFCCDGCRSVYQILSTPELCNYYTINAHPGRPQKEAFRADRFAYLDDPAIAAKVIQFTNGIQTHVTLFLPQIHCSSCLWLLEHLYKLDHGILSSTVAFENKEVFITFRNSTTNLRKVVEMLARIGYEPHLSPGELSLSRKVEPRRKHWYKIGLAGFCFSNIMMLSLPEYLAGPEGIEPEIIQFINILKIILSIPVITYAASGFFIQAWKGLRERYLNIDAPIALALLITFGRSIYEILSGTGAGYLDSMSGIVFFMLLGRWLQDLTYRSISFDRDFKSFFPIAVQVKRGDTIEHLPIEALKVNDIIQVHHGELVPVDAMLSKGEGQIDYSFVTGESIPVPIEKGAMVYAGGKQTEGRIELLVVKEASQSYLTQLWNREDKLQYKNQHHPFIDALSRSFTYLVFAIGFAAAMYWWFQGKPDLMWNALTTILIVACPCALLLSANFTTGNILRILSLNKFYLKNARVLESLSNINTILFDKTGTLTFKSKMKITYEGAPLQADLKNQLAQLLVHSNHPLSKAIYQYLKTVPTHVAEHFKMIPGKGIEGWIEETHIKIGSPAFVGVKGVKSASTVVCVSVDQHHIGTFTLHPEYR